jgi:hypothetical protein
MSTVRVQYEYSMTFINAAPGGGSYACRESHLGRGKSNDAIPVVVQPMVHRVQLKWLSTVVVEPMVHKV